MPVTLTDAQAAIVLELITPLPIPVSGERAAQVNDLFARLRSARAS